MSVTRRLKPLICLPLLAACTAKTLPGENVLVDGEVKAINDKQMLIVDKDSVVTMPLPRDRALISRAKPGQKIKIIGREIKDKDGGSEQIVQAILLEDGTRIYISN